MSITEFFRKRSPLRVHLACGLACSLCAVLAGVAYRLSTELVGPASAQAETKLFGFRLSMAVPSAKPETLNQSKPVTVVASKPSVPATIISYAQPTTDTSVLDVSLSADVDEWAHYEPWTAGRADTYRTVCVRLCDGAYHPISFSTTRSRFKADAAKCQAGCEQPSRLFVVKPEGVPEDMVDVKGGSYTDLPNAFKFQTSYNASCTCRAQPWEAKALDRHRQLAADQRDVSQSVTAQLSTTPVARQRFASLETGSIPPPQLTMPIPTQRGLEVASLAVAPVVIATESAAEAVVMPQTAPVSLRSSAPASVTAQPATLPSAPSEVAAKESRKVIVSKRGVKSNGATEPVKLAKANQSNDRDGLSSKRARRIETTVVVLRPSPPPVKTLVTASSTQRPFRSAEYWRLSFWEAKN